MDKSTLYEIYIENRGAIHGASIGLLFSIIVLLIGILKTLFIAICVGLGYYIGKRMSEDKKYITNVLDRILPPGTYR